MLAGRVAQKTLLGMRFQPDSPRQWLIRMPPKKYTRRAICNKKKNQRNEFTWKIYKTLFLLTKRSRKKAPAKFMVDSAPPYNFCKVATKTILLGQRFYQSLHLSH